MLRMSKPADSGTVFMIAVAREPQRIRVAADLALRSEDCCAGGEQDTEAFGAREANRLDTWQQGWLPVPSFAGPDLVRSRSPSSSARWKVRLA